MSITPGRDVPLLGDNGRPVNNPLVVLNNHLGQITEVLGQIAAQVGGGVPHVYTQQIVQDEHQGKMWGSFCLGCSALAEEYVYPCTAREADPLIPPAFFTIGDVFTPDEHGRMLRVNSPST